MRICRQSLLEEETGAIVSGAVAESHRLCSPFCAPTSVPWEAEAQEELNRSAMSKYTSESLQTEPFRRQVVNWDQALDGHTHVETAQLWYNFSKLLH